MKKRFLSLLLAVFMVMTLVPVAAFAEKNDTDIAYAVTGGNIYFDKETGTITDSDESVTEVLIPSKIDGVAVTRIDHRAFSDCTGLTSITIPDSVTRIYSWAFSDCTSLTTMYANSEDFQVLAITTMVSSFVAEWNDRDMKLHHGWRVMPSLPPSMRSA